MSSLLQHANQKHATSPHSSHMAWHELPFCIVGTGPVSRAFVRALVSADITVSAIASRSARRASKLAQEATKWANETRKVLTIEINSDEENALKAAPSFSERCVVLVAVPDAALDDRLCNKIRRLLPHAVAAIHTSGALQSSVLRGICSNVASLHPCAAFPREAKVPMPLAHVLIGVEGSSPEAEEHGMELARRIGGKPFKIDSERKAGYHAACTMSSNFVWTLVHVSIETLIASGVGRTVAKQISEGLLQSTLQSLRSTSENSIGDALTGPIVRGDACSVRSHLAQLGENGGNALRIYKELAHATAEAAHKNGRIAASTLQEISSALASGNGEKIGTASEECDTHPEAASP